MNTPVLTVEGLCALISGTLSGDGSAPVTGLQIDTRRLAPGEVFFAVLGESADGHEFLEAAQAAGASAAVVCREVQSPNGLPLIQVVDTREALLTFGRRRISDWGGLVVGVTGSAGKTTTKEFIATLLGSRHRVFRTPGNFNNTLGLPMALFHLKEEHTAAVLEMGMSTPGEIAALCGVAPPDIGVVTNVGTVHLSHFPDRDALARAKEELPTGMKLSGTFVWNADDPYVRAMHERRKGPSLSFGTTSDAEVLLLDWRVLDLQDMIVNLQLPTGPHEVRLPMAGGHYARNLAAAVAVALSAGLDVSGIMEAAGRLHPIGMRGEVRNLPGGMTLLDDSYNSNPEAMSSVLETLSRWEGHPPVVLVAGEMRELGPTSPDLHASIGRLAARSGVRQVLGVAGDARHLVAAAQEDGVLARFCENASEAGEMLPGLLRPGDLVVVKGSRGVGLDHVVRLLQDGDDREKEEPRAHKH